ncbi:MAG: Type phosphodiesterase / nucleotide pyrophosphatase [Phycisphaerales bacterium]|nr:Type phosphodiesterase / nucleotide pyrophosphatase [Phycisphaerales bacterium]
MRIGELMKTTAVTWRLAGLMILVLMGWTAATPNIATKLLAADAQGANRTSAGRATNVIVVTLDGMRWQEVFGGFDPMLATEASGGVRDSTPLRAAFARDSAEESRAAILPFFWDVVAKKGQVFGDRGVKNVGRVTNPYKFSYPGYNEMLCGYPDPRINSNDYPANPNVTVLEWLNGRPGFEGRVAAYGAWNRLSRIVNRERSRLPMLSGWEPIESSGGLPLSEREKLLNDLLARTTRMWADEAPDSILQEAAMEYFTRHKPRVFYVMLGETDEWAHGRRYDLYLESARRSDEFIRRLWETAQGMPEYAGKTALVITTDHGRGAGPGDWISHNARTPGSEGWWAAVMGPGIEAKGVIGEGEVTQGQVAATVAGLVGEDWCKAEGRAARGLPLTPSR